MPPKMLVLGTHNRKKGSELEKLLAPHGFELLTLADFVDVPEVEETGTTFAENADLKATQQARHLGHWVLGEDSGLSVDALQGAPGIYSARYSGPGATDERNNQRLLEELADTPLPRRTAHYTCHAALSDPTGKVQVRAEEYCRGRIRFEAFGQGGFGYDPLFEVEEYHRTFGELGPAVKSVLSHRGRAIRRLVPDLLKQAQSGNW